jgi:cysteine desulfurase/selenocysteine lyase
MHHAHLGDRSLFPRLQPRVYLNHGAISPPSIAVREAVTTLLDDYADRGVAAFPTWLEHRQALRTLLAGLIGARAQDIAFVPSTTSGLLMLALSMPWREGERIVVFEGEFPANVTPWQQVAARFGLQIVTLALPEPRLDDTGFLERLEATLRQGVRRVAVSAVQFQTGLRMPLRQMAELCHTHGAELCVDAVQAVGAVPLDVAELGIDYLACGSHKWLMGLEGAGFVYVAPRLLPDLHHTFAGWLSHEEGLGFLSQGPGHLRYDRPIRQSLDFLEVGNLNGAGLAALQASVGLVAQLGVERIYAHVQACLDSLELVLQQRGFHSLRADQPRRRSCTLSVLGPADRDIVAVHAGLMAQGISCSIPDGVLRFTPHWPNRPEEAEIVAEALDRVLA